MEVVDIKKILVPNLLIYIYLHCVRSSSWCATMLATLTYNEWIFESKLIILWFFPSSNQCTLTIEICPRGDHVYICSICFNKGTPSPPWRMIDPLRISCINQAVYSKTIYSCCGIVHGPDLILQCQIFISYRYIGLFYICCVFSCHSSKLADESFLLVLRHNKGIA